MESFPSQFCQEIQSYWRRRKYKRLDGKPAGRKPTKRVTLGGGGGGGGRRKWKLKKFMRLRLRALSPVRLLARLRDSYVDAMLWLAGKAGGSLTVPVGPEVRWDRRVPQPRVAKPKAMPLTEFERRLVAEIYRSLVAYGELPAVKDA